MGTDKPLALVTGASRGIGAACAQALGRDGFHVLVHYLQQAQQADRVAAAIRAAGGSAEILRFDVADAQETAAALEPLQETRGALAALVCNAGIRMDAPLAMMLPGEWHKVIAVNLDSFYNVVKPAVKGMILARRGRIVAITSVSGQTGMAGQVNYAASKAGLVGAVKALAREVGKRSITVNAVAPGYIATDMLAGLDPQQLAGQVPLGRVGTPGDVAAAVSFLVSPAAGYITGHVLSVNGGIYL